MADSTSPTIEDEFLNQEDPTNDSKSIKPIKSALRRSQTVHDLVENHSTNTKPSIKRSVTFAPGLITGKSDVVEIVSDKEEDKENDTDNKHNTNTFDDDENQLLLTPENANLNFMNWRFGSTFSGSETSDTERDFGKMNEKYRTWSRQFMANEERKQKMDQKYKQSVRKIRKTKANISKLRIQIDEEHHAQEADDNTSNTNSANTNERKRRRPKQTVEDSYKKWKKKQNKKGVIYISSVPFGCTSLQLKKIFNEFGMVTNVHLEAAKGEKGKEKKINNRWTEFCEAWIEFKDKKIAKQVVEILNETKIPKKYVKNRLARNHVWNMKYLKGFGWHHLTEYKQTIRTLQRKKYEIKIVEAQRQTDYFESQVRKAMEMSNQMGDAAAKYEGEGNDDAFQSSGDEYNEPPAKKQKLVQQRSGRIRRNHKHNTEILDTLMR
eukprot:125967_1